MDIRQNTCDFCKNNPHPIIVDLETFEESTKVITNHREPKEFRWFNQYSIFCIIKNSNISFDICGIADCEDKIKYHEDVEIKYCPFCGRKLTDKVKEGI